jgi:hypothetical protein
MRYALQIISLALMLALIQRTSIHSAAAAAGAFSIQFPAKSTFLPPGSKSNTKKISITTGLRENSRNLIILAPSISSDTSRSNSLARRSLSTSSSSEGSNAGSTAAKGKKGEDEPLGLTDQLSTLKALYREATSLHSECCVRLPPLATLKEDEERLSDECGDERFWDRSKSETAGVLAKLSIAQRKAKRVQRWEDLRSDVKAALELAADSERENESDTDGSSSREMDEEIELFVTEAIR